VRIRPDLFRPAKSPQERKTTRTAVLTAVLAGDVNANGSAE